MQLLTVPLLFGTLASPWASALIYHDLDLEAVVIDENNSGFVELGHAVETTNYTIPTKKVHRNGRLAASYFSSNPDGYGVTDKCGSYAYEGQEDRVVGGRNAKPGEFPYAVALVRDRSQFCGGSLISNQWILTAAHCIQDGRGFADILVLIGDHDLSRLDDAKHQVRNLKMAYYHQHYNDRLENDIALLHLDKPVTFDAHIQPVCLSNTEPPFGQTCDVAGWGKMGSHLPTSSILKTVSMKVLTHAECRNRYAGVGNVPHVTENMVCASDHNADACNGDSGGPLITRKGKAVQIGVVSWGKGCGDYPGVYTRVNRYLSWIDRVIKSKSD